MVHGQVDRHAGQNHTDHRPARQEPEVVGNEGQRQQHRRYQDVIVTLLQIARLE